MISRRLDSTSQRTAHDLIDPKPAQPPCDRKSLRDAFVIDGIVGQSLEAALAIPVRSAMTDTQERAIASGSRLCLTGERLHRRAKPVGLHAIDDGVVPGIALSVVRHGAIINYHFGF
jgi:hypothetical protein